MPVKEKHKNEIKDILERCELDDSLSKTEIELENEPLKILVDRFVEKCNECLNILNKVTEGDNIELIEDLNAHVENVELKWQQFLALVIKIEQKNSGY